MNKILTPQLPGTNNSQNKYIFLQKAWDLNLNALTNALLSTLKMENGLAISIVWLTSVK